jgi:hypothetical protein
MVQAINLAARIACKRQKIFLRTFFQAAMSANVRKLHSRLIDVYRIQKLMLSAYCWQYRSSRCDRFRVLKDLFIRFLLANVFVDVWNFETEKQEYSEFQTRSATLVAALR